MILLALKNKLLVIKKVLGYMELFIILNSFYILYDISISSYIIYINILYIRSIYYNTGGIVKGGGRNHLSSNLSFHIK